MAQVKAPAAGIEQTLQACLPEKALPDDARSQKPLVVGDGHGAQVLPHGPFDGDLVAGIKKRLMCGFGRPRRVKFVKLPFTAVKLKTPHKTTVASLIPPPGHLLGRDLARLNLEPISIQPRTYLEDRRK